MSYLSLAGSPSNPFLCIATLNDFELRHIDVKNAYLTSNAPSQEEIYMIAPRGADPDTGAYSRVSTDFANPVDKWYLHLHDLYCDLGFVRCQSDWSVYVRRSGRRLPLCESMMQRHLHHIPDKPFTGQPTGASSMDDTIPSHLTRFGTLYECD